MANKEFKIQGETLSLNGVEITTSVDNKVIVPGLTQPTTYEVSGVERFGEGPNTWQNGTIYVIDKARFDLLSGQNRSTIYQPANYTANVYNGVIYTIEIQDNGLMDASDVAALNESTLYATQVVNSLYPFNAEAWVAIPFRPITQSVSVQNAFTSPTGSVTFDGVEIKGNNNSLVLKANADDTVYGLELFNSSDNDTHLKPISSDLGVAVGFAYGSGQSHVRVEGYNGQTGAPNAGNKVAIHSARPREDHIFTVGNNDFTVTAWTGKHSWSEITFTNPTQPFSGRITSITIGDPIIITYSTNTGTQTLETTLNTDFHGNYGQWVGRVNANVPDDANDILSINIPDYSSYRNAEWTFNNDGVLQLPENGIIKNSDGINILGDLKINGGLIYNHANSNSSITIAPGGESTSYIQIPGNSESDNNPLQVHNGSQTGAIEFVAGGKTMSLHADGKTTVPGLITTKDEATKHDNTIINITNESPAKVYLMSSSVISASDKVLIDGVLGDMSLKVNGVWYANPIDLYSFTLYHDKELTQPVDSTDWGYFGDRQSVTGTYTNPASKGYMTVNLEAAPEFNDVSAGWFITGPGIGKGAYIANATTFSNIKTLNLQSPTDDWLKNPGNFRPNQDYTFIKPLPEYGTWSGTATFGGFSENTTIATGTGSAKNGSIKVATPNRTWAFNDDGSLELPSGAKIHGSSEQLITDSWTAYQNAQNAWATLTRQNDTTLQTGFHPPYPFRNAVIDIVTGPQWIDWLTEERRRVRLTAINPLTVLQYYPAMEETYLDTLIAAANTALTAYKNWHYEAHSMLFSLSDNTSMAFRTDGSLQLPSGGKIASELTSTFISPGLGSSALAGFRDNGDTTRAYAFVGGVKVETNRGTTAHEWWFDNSGNLRLPTVWANPATSPPSTINGIRFGDSTLQTTAYTGIANGAGRLVSDDTDVNVELNGDGVLQVPRSIVMNSGEIQLPGGGTIRKSAGKDVTDAAYALLDQKAIWENWLAVDIDNPGRPTQYTLSHTPSAVTRFSDIVFTSSDDVNAWISWLHQAWTVQNAPVEAEMGPLWISPAIPGSLNNALDTFLTAYAAKFQRVESLTKSIDIKANNSVWSFGADDALTLPNYAALKPHTNTSLTTAETNLAAAKTAWEDYVLGSLAGKTLHASLSAPKPDSSSSFAGANINSYNKAVSWIAYVNSAWQTEVTLTYNNYDNLTLVITPAMGESTYNQTMSLLATLRDCYKVWETLKTSTDFVMGDDTWAFSHKHLTLPSSISIETSQYYGTGTQTAVNTNIGGGTVSSGTNVQVARTGPTDLAGAGWVIKFADGTTRTIVSKTSIIGGTGWALEFEQDYTSSTAYPITLISPDYTPVSPNLLSITGANKTWNFTPAGDFELPGGASLSATTSSLYLKLNNNNSFTVINNDSVEIKSNNNAWTFDSTGKLTLPGGSYNSYSSKIYANYNIELLPTFNGTGTGPSLSVEYNDGVILSPRSNDYKPGGHHTPMMIEGTSEYSDSTPPGDVSIVAGHNWTTSASGTLNLGTYNTNTVNVKGWSFNSNGNLVAGGILVGPSSYNQPNFIQPNSSDTGWAYGIYNSSTNYWMQTKFYGQGQATRGVRFLEAEGNTVVFSVNGSGDATIASSLTTNILNIAQTTEKFQAYSTGITSGSTITLNCATGNIFYITSTVNGNWTANFTNLNIASGTASTVSLIISQGATGYYPNALQIAGTSQTINWQGNTTPTASSSRKDVVTFSILNNSGTYIVLGQITGF